MIFVDLDGVLADFETGFERRFGYSIHNTSKELKNEIWKEMTDKHQDFYRRLPLMPDAKKLVKYLNSLKEFKTVLTAIPRRGSWPGAETDKSSWFRIGFPECIEWDFETGPYSHDKQFHCEYPTDVLIDDKPRNIGQWINQGGIGIHHTSADATIEILKEIYSGVADRQSG